MYQVFGALGSNVPPSEVPLKVAELTPRLQKPDTHARSQNRGLPGRWQDLIWCGEWFSRLELRLAPWTMPRGHGRVAIRWAPVHGVGGLPFEKIWVVPHFRTLYTVQLVTLRLASGCDTEGGELTQVIAFLKACASLLSPSNRTTARTYTYAPTPLAAQRARLSKGKL